jgi:polyisoprenoid-binding protein YceI
VHHAERWPVDPVVSRIDFSLRHLGIETLVGQFRRFEGTVSADHAQVLRELDLTLAVDSVDTGEPRRDAHVRAAGVFGGAEHPSVRLRSTWVRPLAHDRYRVDALLTMHGATHYVELVTAPGAVEARAAGERLYLARAEGVLDWRQWQVLAAHHVDVGGLVLGHDVHLKLTLGAALGPPRPAWPLGGTEFPRAEGT